MHDRAAVWKRNKAIGQISQRKRDCGDRANDAPLPDADDSEGSKHNVAVKLERDRPELVIHPIG